MLGLMLVLHCFFPLVDHAGDFVGLSILNRENEAREFTITAVSSEGAALQTARVTLGAANQKAILLTELFGSRLASEAGWLRVDTNSSGCSSYVAVGNHSSVMGFEGAEIASSTIYLPQVSVNTGFLELGHTETRVVIVNPGDITANVDVGLFGLEGGLRGRIPIGVPPRGTRSVRVSELFSAVIPANNAGGKTFEGYIRLVSDAPIAAWERIDTPLSRSVLRGRGVEEIQTMPIAVLPHFAFGGNYGSFVNIVNPGSNTLSLVLSAVDDRGRDIGEVIRFSLGAGEVRRASVGELFRVVLPAIFPAPLISGQVRIRSQNGAGFQLLGNIDIFRASFGGRDSSMLHPLSQTAATDWTIPFATTMTGYFTGYAVAAPNELLAVQTDIRVEIVRADGSVASHSTISLSPRNRQSVLVPEVLGGGGYLRLTSSLPFYVLAVVGTHDGRLLDQLPAIP